MLSRLCSRLLLAVALFTGFGFTTVRAEGLTLTGVLSHSAVAALDDQGQIDVHTTSNDEIQFTLEHVGADTALFNGIYELQLVKRDDYAFYYLQPSPAGVIIWAYFPKSETVTYAKLRAFPVLGTPSSYLMIAKTRRKAQ